MYLSQSKAARLAGVSRPTIKQRIDDNMLSVQPDGIDIADLRRLFTYITDEDVERINMPAAKRKKLEEKRASSTDDMSSTEKTFKQMIEDYQQRLDAQAERLQEKDKRLAEREDWFTEQLEAQRVEHKTTVQTLTALLEKKEEVEPDDKPSMRQRVGAWIAGKPGTTKAAN